ncbi:MAG TPA: EscU/YscU/HrcU family type III secretion system export apparatus switch protein [Opitutaceae bacterium]|nr:EscU/YscU/HrcU family type III secretion system export apparatus switch protein [Opitutaceae bacterium]
MADEDKESKTEQATGKRINDAILKGQFPKSPEITLVFTLVAALAIFSFTASTAAREVGGLTEHIFTQLGTIRLRLDAMPTELSDVPIVIAKVLGPIIGTIVLAVLLAGGLQSGFNFTPEVLGLHWGAMNPMNGFKKVISKDAFIHAGIDALKMTAIGLTLWTVAKGLLDDPIFTAPVEAAYLGIYLHRTFTAFLSQLILALGVIAAVSYWYAIMKSKKDMMMTKQEVKDEHKQSEGDGRVKGVMRRMARRLLQKQMLKQVPMADVIVTNPTHYAVALRYERGIDQAPIVLAKGENQFARRIKALAAEHGVPMVENRPVARMLYALGRVDEPIPSELYQAVAEILAFVYRTHRYYFYRLRARRNEAAAAEKTSTGKTETDERRAA